MTSRNKLPSMERSITCSGQYRVWHTAWLPAGGPNSWFCHSSYWLVTGMHKHWLHLALTGRWQCIDIYNAVSTYRHLNTTYMYTHTICWINRSNEGVSDTTQYNKCNWKPIYYSNTWPLEYLKKCSDFIHNSSENTVRVPRRICIAWRLYVCLSVGNFT